MSKRESDELAAKIHEAHREVERALPGREDAFWPAAQPQHARTDQAWMGTVTRRSVLSLGASRAAQAGERGVLQLGVTA